MALRLVLSLLTLIVLCAFATPLLFVLKEGWGAISFDTPGLLLSLFTNFGLSSLLLAFGSVFGAVIIGGVCAYYCARFEFPMRPGLFWCAILPLAVPSYLVCYVWVDFLIELGVPGSALRNIPVTCLVFAVCLSPYVFLPTYASLVRISDSILESGRLFYASKINVFWRVEFPLVMGGLFVGALLAAMEVLADFGTVDFMAIDTWSTAIYRAWYAYNDRGQAALLALFLLLFSGILLYLQHALQHKKSIYSNPRQRVSAKREPLQGIRALPAMLVLFVPAFLSVMFPLVYLIYQAVVWTNTASWQSAVQPFFNTLFLTFVSSAFVVFVGLVLAAILQQKCNPVITVMAKVSSLGYALPGGVLGIGLLAALSTLSLTGSFVGLIFAYAIRFATIGASTIGAGWQSLGTSYQEQGWLLGLQSGGVFLRITLPLLKTHLGCAFVLAAMDIIKELPATMLLRPFHYETLAVRTYNLASDERLADTAPASLAIILLCMLGIFVAQKWGAFGISAARNTAPQRESGFAHVE